MRNYLLSKTYSGNMLMMCAGMRWPNDTTTPKSYLILVLPSDINACQSQHSECRFCSVYFFTGFPLALNDVTTSNRWIFELLHFLKNEGEKCGK